MPAQSGSGHRHSHRAHTSNSHGNSSSNQIISPPSIPNATPQPSPDSIFAFNSSTDPTFRRQFLNSVIAGCTHAELLYLSSTVSPLLRRDFLTYLPPELGYYILSFIDEPKTLMRASLVSKHWMRMLRDETLWRRMCLIHGFENWEEGRRDLVKKVHVRVRKGKERERDGDAEGESDAALGPAVYKFSYRRHFRTDYIIKQNWLTGGRILQTHKIRSVPSGDDTVTSLAMDDDWIVVGLSSSRIKVYSTVTGVLCRTLVGHDSGVWGVCLVMKGGWRVDSLASPMSSVNPARQGVNEQGAAASGTGSNDNINVGLGSRDTFVLNPLPSERAHVTIVQNPSSRKKRHRHRKDDVSASLPEYDGTLSLTATTQSNVPSSSSASKRTSKPPNSGTMKRKHRHDKPPKFKLSKAEVAAARVGGVDIDPPVPLLSSSSSSHPTSSSYWHNNFANNPLSSHPHSASSATHPHPHSHSHPHTRLNSNNNAHHPSDGMHVMPSESHDHLLSPLLRLALGLDPLEDCCSSSGDCDTENGESGSDDAVVGGVMEEGEEETEEEAGKESSGGSSCAEAGSVREDEVEEQDVREGRDRVVSDDPRSAKSHSRARSQPHSQHASQQPQPQPVPEPRFQMLPDDLSPNQPTVDPKLCMASVGWGQPNSIIVSGGCDKVVRVWEAKSGYCIYVLHGHTSTIRSIRVLDNRPLAITGSRDSTLRVWDIQRGRCVHVLEGHEASVRCLDVNGSTVVSGSYDRTCRVWNVDTGECLHVLRGHFSQIYDVAFDGVRIASGGMDTTVRIWDVATGHCTALLQGHSALVCTLQLSKNLLITGSADGKVISFSLSTLSRVHCISAHDSSVTSLQFTESPNSNSSTTSGTDSGTGSGSGSGFLVTGGNDGRARLWDVKTGEWIRDLTGRSECVWKVGFLRDVVVVLCKRGGGSVVEIWSLRGLGRRRTGVGAGAMSPVPVPVPVGVGVGVSNAGTGAGVGGLLGVGSADVRD